METRPPNVEGKGEIRQRELVKNALRMRPDRVILGEVRGEEAFDMLQAMNTGHEGSMATLHANTPRDAITRLEQMVAMGDMKITPEAVAGQIASTGIRPKCLDHILTRGIKVPTDLFQPRTLGPKAVMPETEAEASEL